jgi:hypothetical protein
MTRLFSLLVLLVACGPPEPDPTTPEGFAEAYAEAACGCAKKPAPCRDAVASLVLLDLAEASCVELDADQADLCVASVGALADTRDTCSATTALYSDWSLLAVCPGLCPTDDDTGAQ